MTLVTVKNFGIKRGPDNLIGKTYHDLYILGNSQYLVPSSQASDVEILIEDSVTRAYEILATSPKNNTAQARRINDPQILEALTEEIYRQTRS